MFTKNKLIIFSLLFISGVFFYLNSLISDNGKSKSNHIHESGYDASLEQDNLQHKPRLNSFNTAGTQEKINARTKKVSTFKKKVAQGFNEERVNQQLAELQAGYNGNAQMPQDNGFNAEPVNNDIADADDDLNEAEENLDEDSEASDNKEEKTTASAMSDKSSKKSQSRKKNERSQSSSESASFSSITTGGYINQMNPTLSQKVEASTTEHKIASTAEEKENNKSNGSTQIILGGGSKSTDKKDIESFDTQEDFENAVNTYLSKLEFNKVSSIKNSTNSLKDKVFVFTQSIKYLTESQNEDYIKYYSFIQSQYYNDAEAYVVAQSLNKRDLSDDQKIFAMSLLHNLVNSDTSTQDADQFKSIYVDLVAKVLPDAQNTPDPELLHAILDSISYKYDKLQKSLLAAYQGLIANS